MPDNKHILVVDDDNDCRLLVSTVLTNNGYLVSQCSDGIEAISFLQQQQQIPSLLILDIMMPKMSGYDVVIHMRTHPRTQKLPIIMLTAKGEQSDIMKGYNEYLVDYYISKPFTTKQILNGVEMLIG